MVKLIVSLESNPEDKIPNASVSAEEEDGSEMERGASLYFCYVLSLAFEKMAMLDSNRYCELRGDLASNESGKKIYDMLEANWEWVTEFQHNPDNDN